MQARHTPPSALTLIGARHEYEALIHLLMEAIHPHVTLEVPEHISPHPYDAFLTEMRFHEGESKLIVSVQDTTLMMTGNRVSLLCFCDYLRFVCGEVSREVPWSHLHFDYYEGHQCIDSDSMPLVIEVTYE